MRLHTPSEPETVARKLVEVIQVRGLDLKKPPSPSRSTAAPCSCSGRRTSTRHETMSIIVKHRTDLDTVAERVGVSLEGGAGVAFGGSRTG